MPQAILYCDLCDRIIPPGDLARGQAMIGEETAVCPECAASLTPEQRAVLERKIKLKLSWGKGLGPNHEQLAVVERKLKGARPARKPTPAPAGGRRPGHGGASASSAGPARKTSRLTAISGRKVKRGSRTGLAVAVAGVGALAGAALLLFVLAGPERGRAAPRGETGPRPPADPSTTPAIVRPPDPVPPTTTPAIVRPPDPVPPIRPEPPQPDPAEAAARRRLAEIADRLDELPDGYGAIRAALDGFQKEFPGAPEREEAGRLLERVDVRYVEIAESELATAREKVLLLSLGGRFERASEAFDRLRSRFAGSDWLKRSGERAIASALSEVEESRKAAAGAAIGRARIALRSGDFAAAREALEGRAGWPEEFRSQAEEIVKEIAKDIAGKESALREKRKSKGPWRRFLVEFHEKGKLGLKNAGSLLEAERERLEEAGLREKLSRIDARLRAARTVEELAAAGFAASRRTVHIEWKGRPFACRVRKVEDGVLQVRTTTGSVLAIPLGELKPRHVVGESGVSLKPVAAASYFLMRGDLDGARARLEGAGGWEVRELREELDDFARALAPPEERKPRGAPGSTQTPAPARMPS